MARFEVKTLFKVCVTTTPEAEEAVMELLGSTFNCPASAYFDLEKNESRVSVYSPNRTTAEQLETIRDGIKQIKKCELNIGSIKIKTSKIRRKDWAESWKRHFKPIEIGKSLLIKPSWIKKRPLKNRALIVLDPGLSFGTGQHPTTEFCLREIVRASLKNPNSAKSFLDIGTGSGILAIAAAKLGFKPVRAFDFDPESVRVAKANAKSNNALKKITLTCDDATKLSTKPTKQFDLVCANLISNLLINERRKIIAQVKRGGVLVLAGILDSEFSEVQKAFEDLGLRLVSSKRKREWRSGSFTHV